MNEEQKPTTLEPAAEQTQEQAPMEEQSQAQEQDVAGQAEDKIKAKKGLSFNDGESIIPTVQKTQVDPNKTEGGVLLDAIISNVYAAFQRRQQRKKQRQQEDKSINPEGRKISADEFTQLMRQLEKEGVDLVKLHQSGDMDRLLQGHLTKEVYTRTPQGSWLERSGALFIGSDNQIHQTLIKQDRVMEKDLTAKENEQLRTEGEVLKGDTLIKRNPKTNRVVRIPASPEAKQRQQKPGGQQIKNRRAHAVAPKKKMVKRGL